jgi:hypothetical protein
MHEQHKTKDEPKYFSKRRWGVDFALWFFRDQIQLYNSH